MRQRPDGGDHSARVLIVDDERQNRQLLEVMLAPEGYLLQTAASGEEALAKVALEPPDLILLDIMMPGMDGFQVVTSIKGNHATRNIPVIIVTALEDRSARMSGLRAGAEEFLTKPVDRVELTVRVRNLLRLKAYGDCLDDYSQMLEGEVISRTADLVERTKQAAILAEQAALLDLAQDAIVVRDLGNRILFWSRGAEVMYGWLREEAIGRITDELLKPEFREPAEHIQAALLTDGRWQGEAIHVKRDGTRVDVASRWALQRDADGTPVRVLTIDNDITTRKQVEEASEQNRKDQLRFKDDFLSHVSHELRSPLTAIKQFTSILASGLAGELNQEQREYQQIVLKNIQQLQSMIDDLVEVTRLETGKLTVEPESVSVADAVADALHTLQESARAKGVTLSCELAPDLPSAFADPTRLRQILIILLDNAIKFTPDGGVATLRGRVQEKDRRFLIFEVSDTGCGISPELGERLFERLYQVSGQIQGSRKGLGLGLYIGKELVTRQGGTIWVDARQQRGCAIAFTVPVWSLNSAIAPLLINEKWPSESIALAVVEVRSTDTPLSKDAQREWFREVRNLLERCLLPDLDVLLSSMSFGPQVERIFLAAFADEKGASVLVNRIREQCGRLTQSHPGRALLVSYSMLQPCPWDGRASGDDRVSGMARHLEAAIQSKALPEAVYYA